MTMPLTTGALRLGILGTGGIVRMAVPQMQQATNVVVAAVASRDSARAAAVAGDLGIAQSFGSYEALLASPEIDAVHIALPIAHHTEWAVKALRAGNHVLCEKPLAADAAGVAAIAAEARRTGLVAWEGLMLRHHPQWQAITRMLAEGRIGEVRAVQGMLCRVAPNAFDANATANRAELGGGVVLDNGCYMLHLGRLAFGAEPLRVASIGERDPEMGVVTYVSSMLQFSRGTASFTLSSRLKRMQRLLIVGTRGSIEVRTPVMPHPVRPTEVIVDFADTPMTTDPEVLQFGPVPSFKAQIEAFAAAVRNAIPGPFDLASSYANAMALEALERSALRNGEWVEVSSQTLPAVRAEAMPIPESA
jgi:predicted dehydrogenase